MHQWLFGSAGFSSMERIWSSASTSATPVFRSFFSGAEPPIYIVLFGFFVAAIIVIKHIPNIKRIMNHEESKFYFRRKPKIDEFETEDDDGGK